MQSEKKMIMETLLRNLTLQANRLKEAVDKPKSFNCRKMGKQVSQLLQILDRLRLCGPIHPVLSEVSGVLQEALNLACKCKRRTFSFRLFNGAQTTNDFQKLFRLLDVCICIANMNWLLIIYNPDFNSAFNEIFLSLPRILSNDSSIPSAWSGMLLIMLKSDNVRIVEGLMLCLAKLVGAEHGELRCNYLMSIMEIAAAAEYNRNLIRCNAFKINSPDAKAVVEELLRVINQSEDPKQQVLAIRSIGSLARIYTERTNRHVINALVSQLGNGHQEVATEAVVALKKFACKDNYIRKTHSMRMIEFNAVQPLVKLLRDGEWTQLQLHGLVLMCYLALNTGYSEAMEQARVRTVIQHLVTGKRGRRTVVSQHPELKELVAKALKRLIVYYRY